MRGIAEDIRFALRMMVNRRAFTAVVVITLALGIGANTAIFSIVNSFLLKPLPFAEPDELTYLGEYFRDTGHPGVTSWVNFVDFREQNSVFEDMAAWWSDVANMSGRGEPLRVNTAVVSSNYFSVLGVQPLFGPGFTSDAVIREDRVVVLSESLWRSRFGADSEVVGSSVTLDGESFAIAGVMPASRGASALDFGERVQIWQAVSADDLGIYATVRGGRWARVVARLARGRSVDQAQAEFNTISTRFATEYPDSNRNWSTRITPLHEFLVSDARLSLMVLLGAVVLVLLIACANVANLQLARAAVRTQEIAMRTALGAGRGRIIRQMLTENVLLSLGGGVLGLLVAVWGLRIPQSLSLAGGLPLGAIRVDSTVLLFTLLLSIVTGLLFGLAPAVITASPSLTRFLGSGSRDVSSSSRRGGLRHTLVIVEVALALVLLVGAGLLIKSFARLQRVDPGFKTDRVLTAKLSLPETTYPEPHQRAGFFEEVLEEISALPGVVTAGAVSNLPMASDTGDRGFRIEGRPELGPDESQVADYSRSTPGYFDAMGVNLVAGRVFDPTDTSESMPVVVINRTMADRYWSQGEPVGARIRLGGVPTDEPIWRTVVGVVGDVRHKGLDVPVAPQVYLPYAQDPIPSMAIAIRTAGDPVTAVESLRQAVASVDPALPIAEVRTMERVVADSSSSRRLTNLLLVAFAVIAVVLAAVGIYGVIAYSVGQRTHEFGLRMALGAKPAQLMTMVMRQGFVTTLVGLAIGLVGALGAGRLAAGLLFEISPHDPLVLFGVATILAVVALVACWIPAHRASRVLPMAALRHQ